MRGWGRFILASLAAAAAGSTAVSVFDCPFFHPLDGASWLNWPILSDALVLVAVLWAIHWLGLFVLVLVVWGPVFVLALKPRAAPLWAEMSAAGVLACVCSAAVGWLESHTVYFDWPRAAGLLPDPIFVACGVATGLLMAFVFRSVMRSGRSQRQSSERVTAT